MKKLEDIQRTYSEPKSGSLFCDKCGALLFPARNNWGEKIVRCAICAFAKPLATEEDYLIQQRIAHSERDFTLISEEPEYHDYLPTSRTTCLKCGFSQAIYWQILVQPDDGDQTQFFRCCQCGHTWRVAG